MPMWGQPPRLSRRAQRGGFFIPDGKPRQQLTLGSVNSFQEFTSSGLQKPYCPAGLSILLATLTPLNPFAYLAMPR